MHARICRPVAVDQLCRALPCPAAHLTHAHTLSHMHTALTPMTCHVRVCLSPSLSASTPLHSPSPTLQTTLLYTTVSHYYQSPPVPYRAISPVDSAVVWSLQLPRNNLTTKHPLVGRWSLHYSDYSYRMCQHVNPQWPGPSS